MGIRIPLLKFKQDFDSQSTEGRAFEILKGMHEPVKIGDWILQLYHPLWKKERAVVDSCSSFHPCAVYLYKTNRSK